MSDIDDLKLLYKDAEARGDRELADKVLLKLDEIGSKTKQEPTTINRAEQAAGGFNEGILRTVGAFTGDLANNLANLARAGYGSAMNLAGHPDLAPDIVEAKDAPLTGDWLVNRAPSSIFGPRTGDTTERYLRKAGEFAGASVIGPSAGVATRTGVGAISGVTSQAAAEAFPESRVAPLVGALAPTALALGASAAVRGGLRGTPSNAEKMRTEIAAQETVGMPADAAVAQRGRISSMLKYMGRAPGGVKVVAEKGQAIQAGMKGGLDKLTPASTEPSVVGADISRSIDSFAKTASTKWKRIDDALDLAVPKGTSVTLVSTKKALDDLTAQVSDPAFRSAFKNPEVLDSLKAAIANKSTVDFKTANEIRRIIGQKANDAALIADVSKGQWKNLYGALKTDIGSSLRQGSREADLFTRSNRYWSAVHSRIDDIYGPIAGLGTPEAKYFKSVSALNRGATQLTAIRKIMPKAEFTKLKDTFISDMGKANPGKQNELGDVFSSERFLTNWSSLSQDAKKSLIGNNTDLRRNLDLVAKQASNIRSIESIYQNPSGTGLAAGSIATGGMIIGSALSGNWQLAGAILGAMGVNNISARALTNPKFAKFLADTTTVRHDRMPAIVNRFQIELNKDKQLRDDLLSGE